MRRIIKILKFIGRLFSENYKTIYFNFHYLPFRKAIEFPVILSRKVYLRKTKGTLTIDGPVSYGMIKMGFGEVGIFDKKVTRCIWEVAGTVKFLGRAQIGFGSKFSVAESGELIIGANFSVKAESTIIVIKKVEFGKNCLLSWDILVMDTDFHKIKNEHGFIINNPEQIMIGDHVWIGCRCLILKGASIPNNSVLGANSVFGKKMDNPNSIYSGSPAKLIKENITWER